MNRLKKKEAFSYIKDLLQSKVKVIDDVRKYDLKMGELEFNLPNVELIEESIVIKNFLKFSEQIKEQIKEIDEQIQNYEDNISKDEMKIIGIEELKIEKVKKLDLIEKMEKLYKDVHVLAKQNGAEYGKEIVLIETLLQSKSANVSRELISRKVNFEINQDDYSIVIMPQSTITIEIDAFEISKLDMYSEIKSLIDNISESNIGESAEKIIDLLKVSYSDIEVENTFMQLVIRNQNLKSVIEDYNNIIEEVDEDEILDDYEKPVIEGSASNLINENELYLPFPSNDEQKTIAWKLNKGNVAVQGPPGTGKTHTIVNIISHMLAKGNSILVVSENKDALEVIHKKMPVSLQPLIIPMLGGAVETRKHTEDSIKNIISKNDTFNTKIEEEKIQVILKNRELLQEELSININKQIDSYVTENKDLELYGQMKKLSEWIKDINVNKVKLDDCLTSDIDIDVIEIQRLLSYDQSLLLKTVQDYIKSNLLVGSVELENLNKIFVQFPTLTLDIISKLEKLPEINIPSIKYENLDEIFIHWSENDEEFLIDSDDANTLIELEKSKTKHKRVLLENEIYIPEKLSIYDINDIINNISNRSLPNFMQKILNKKAKEIKINGNDLWRIEENINILKAYYESEVSNQKRIRINNRFNEYFKVELSTYEISQIIELYKQIIDINDIVSTININLFEEKYKDDKFELVKTAHDFPIIAKIASKYFILGQEVLSNLKPTDELYKEFDNINQEIKTKDFNIEKYEDFVKKVKYREEKYATSKDILNIKNKLDKASPSLYSKLISNEIDSSIINTWKENYIYSQVNKINKEEYKNKIESIRKKISKINIELVETMAWNELIKKIGQEEKEAMQTWVTLMNKIGKGTGKNAPKLKRQAQIQMDKIKNKVPVWVTTRSQVSELFKYDKENKFDLVIFDESSQSTLEALSVLERGKKKLIVGDDKQISPVSFLKTDNVNKLRENYFEQDEHILLAHDTTLFDYASAKYDVVRLREHFRCLPEIIKFSNDLQYGGEMVPLKTINTSEKLTPVVESIFVESGYVTSNGTNKPEAREIVQRVKEMISDEKYKDKSIGIIILKTEINHEKYINELLYRDVGFEMINKHNIKVATSNSFQGDERDVILLSLVTARKEGEDDIKTTALTRQMYYQRYNVAASRAKEKMVLFHSIRNSDIHNKECVQFKLLEFFENFDKNQMNFELAKSKFDSIFEEEVFKALNDRGYNVIPQYESNGFKIDLVVEAKEGKLAIECDGERYHGREQFEADFKRQAVLERAGWTFYRIRGRDYFSNKETTIQNLIEYLEENQLYPII